MESEAFQRKRRWGAPHVGTCLTVAVDGRGYGNFTGNGSHQSPGNVPSSPHSLAPQQRARLSLVAPDAIRAHPHSTSAWSRPFAVNGPFGQTSPTQSTTPARRPGRPHHDRQRSTP